MSRFARELALQRPDWPDVPDVLERAWAWLEARGHGAEVAGGYVLSPYADGEGGPAFLTGLSLDGWFEPGSDAHAQLLPIGEAAGDGSILALWRDDAGEVRGVVLGSEGSGYVVADDPAALLALLAVGYDELIDFNLGDEPEEPLPADALAPLREWVTAELGLEVPDAWPAVADDDFSAWIDVQLGNDTTPAPAPEDRGTRVTGVVTELLALLGEPDDEAAADRIHALTGAKAKAPLRSSTAALRRVGLELARDRHGIQMIMIRLTDRPVGPIARRAQPAYPHSSVLIEGLDENSTKPEALELLGTPEREGPTFLRYVVDGRYLHLGFDDDLLATLTLMVTAP